MPEETTKTLDTRLTIVEYRLDEAHAALNILRTEYQTETAALRKTLQGIEKNLSAIKWIGIGAGTAFLINVTGLGHALEILKVLL